MLYENIVKTIIDKKDDNRNFEIIIEEKNKIDDLNKKIINMRNKIKLEKQFNKKVELNQKLQQLKKELGELNEN